MEKFGNLPMKVIQEILLPLNLKATVNCWNAFYKWRDSMRDEYFWKTKCKKENFTETNTFLKSNFFRRYPYWQALYFYEDALFRNWRGNIHKEISFETPRNVLHRRYSIYYVDDDILVMAERNFENGTSIVHYNETVTKTVRIDQNSMLIEKVLRYQNLLIFINVLESTYITVWNLTDGTFVYKILLAKLSIQSSQMCKNLILIEATNERICIFNVDTALATYENEIVQDLCVSGARYAILRNNTVTVTNAVDNSVSNFSSCDAQLIVRIVLNGKHLLCLSQNGHACIWNLEEESQSKHFKIDVQEDLLHDFPDDLLELQDAVERVDHHVLLSRYHLIYKGYTSLQVWNYTQGIFCYEINPNVNFFNFSCNNYCIFLYDMDNEVVQMWSLETGKLVTSYETPPVISETKLIFTNVRQILNSSCTNTVTVLDYLNC